MVATAKTAKRRTAKTAAKQANQAKRFAANPVIGRSPAHFDRNICVAIKSVTTGKIVAKSVPFLSAVEAERVHESPDEFFEFVCVPADGIGDADLHGALQRACE